MSGGAEACRVCLTAWRCDVAELVRVGSAYRGKVEDGRYLWVRHLPKGWVVIHEYRDPSGERQWAELGTFRTAKEAKADALALLHA